MEPQAETAPPPPNPLRSRPFLLLLAAWLLVTGLLTYSAQASAARLAYASPDDALMLQQVWNTGRGRVLACSLERLEAPWETHAFAAHLDVSHFLYVPLTWISDSNALVFALQIFLTLGGVVPLFLLAHRRLKSARLAAAVGGLYLLYPLLDANAIRLGAYFNLTVPLVLLALERLDAGKLRAAAAAFLFAPFTREEAALPIAVFLVTLALVDRERRAFALGVAGGCLLVFFAYVGILRPHVFGPGPSFLGRYSHLGDSFAGVVFSPLHSPLVVAKHVFAPKALHLWALLLLPLCPAVALSPRHLLASFAPVVVVGLSNRASDYVLGHYLVPAIPFLFAGLVVGLDRIRTSPRLDGLRALGWNPTLTAIILACALTAATWTDAGPFARYKPLRALDPGRLRTLERIHPEHRQALQLVERIPTDASVSASNHLLIHLARRRELYLFPTRTEEVDYVLVDTRDYLPFRYPPIPPGEHTRAVRAARSEPGVVVTGTGHFLLIDRRAAR